MLLRERMVAEPAAAAGADVIDMTAVMAVFSLSLAQGRDLSSPEARYE
jgi:hypothetical protein